jgi:short-subunit dehydrogenase
MFFSKNKNQILKNKVAIITGGSRGIGKAVAVALAEQGCNIVINSRTESELKEAEKEIESKNVDVLAIKADVSKLSDVKKVVKESIKKFKRINILVNNAGIGPYKSLKETSYQELESILDINLKGLIYFTKEALPYLQKEGFARIVNISSGIGKVGVANFTVYCAAKFGVIGFTEALADELKDIKVYSVCPGATDTKLYRSNFPYSRNFLIDKPEKIAKVVLKLCTTDNIKSGESVNV